MPLPLLQTKFHIPALLPTLVPRPRLFTKLNAKLNGKLTVVTAPAGSGKTTLICDWLHQTNLPAVWLSLDGGDNDLQRVLRYVIGALQSAQPAVGQETLSLLQLPQLAAVDELLTPLLNDLATFTQKLILVLDDYHVIGEHISQFLTVLWMALISGMMLRSTVFRAWQGWFGLVAAVVYLLAQSELLATVIPGFPQVPEAGLIGSMLWLLWMIVMGVTLLRSRSAEVIQSTRAVTGMELQAS